MRIVVKILSPYMIDMTYMHWFIGYKEMLL